MTYRAWSKFLSAKRAKNFATEPMILYVQLYGGYQEMVRKKSEFLEEVDRPDFNYKGPRFRYIGEP